MLYSFNNEQIPQDKRKEVNDKILYLINNDLCGQYEVTRQDVYDSYTGDGHLHGLNFKDYGSYHEFSEAKKDIENGQFFTSPHILEFIANCIKPTNQDIIADLTSGRGDWFNFCPVQQNCYSNELDVKAYKVQKFLYPDVNITNGDVRTYTPDVSFDIVFLNPPFGLNLRYDGDDWNSENLCVYKASQLLKHGGILALLVPQSFCADYFMNKTDINNINKNFNFICQIDLPDDSFKHVGIKKFPTKVIFLQRKSEHITEQSYFNISKLPSDTSAEKIYDDYIKPVLDVKHAIRHKLMREKQSKLSDDFLYKVNKLKYHISTHPKTKGKLIDCESYLNKFYNQTKPDSMSYEDWEKSKITENKVLAYFKRVVNLQNKTEKDVIKLVKTKNEIKLKAYSQKSKIHLSKMECEKTAPISSLVYHDYYPFSDKTYVKFTEKERAKFEQQSISFKDMTEDLFIKKWLDNTTLYDNEQDKTIKLNSKQQNIVNLMLQKQYGYIQASQGSGKTLMGIHMAMYRNKYQHTRNTIVIAPAIAIKGTWCGVLENYSIPYVQVSKMSDFNKVKNGDFILFTFNMVCKYKKQLKNFIKQSSKNVYTIIDEADSICNISSKRYKAVMSSTFKSRYKTCLSGTMTRNNIAEAFTQFLWLYGSSYNFMCDCKEIYKKGKEFVEPKENDWFNKPFKMFNGGYSLFRSCYNPEKITVMGIEQQNQDIYNQESLRKLSDKTIITKSFEEIVGKKIYTLHQNLVEFSDSEQELYRIAIENFMDMKYLFTSTGNARKDKMLEILQQLNLLLDICRFPQKYKEYNSSSLPTKFIKVLSMLNDWNDEYVAIGCRTLKEVELYQKMIEDECHDRQLFVITGSVDIAQRKNIIKKLKESKNGILLSTQQSLSSSVNIPFVNKCIITSMPYNMASLSQYYFRFVRYDSTEDKEIHFVLYADSLECNLLGLLMSKEKLVRFLKDVETDDDELNDEFNVDFDLVSMLLSKERDSDNKVRVNWGKNNF